MARAVIASSHVRSRCGGSSAVLQAAGGVPAARIRGAPASGIRSWSQGMEMAIASMHPRDAIAHTSFFMFEVTHARLPPVYFAVMCAPAEAGFAEAVRGGQERMVAVRRSLTGQLSRSEVGSRSYAQVCDVICGSSGNRRSLCRRVWIVSQVRRGGWIQSRSKGSRPCPERNSTLLRTSLSEWAGR